MNNKDKVLAADELRVISVGATAVEELLFETLMEHKQEFFDVDDADGQNICFMNWDRTDGTLMYVVVPIKQILDGYELDFDSLRKHVGITTDSLYKTNRFRSIRIE